MRLFAQGEVRGHAFAGTRLRIGFDEVWSFLKVKRSIFCTKAKLLEIVENSPICAPVEKFGKQSRNPAAKFQR
jgi:hypothetical protein